MTTETSGAGAVEYVSAAFPEAGHIMFGVPGVPYSQVKIPLVYDINEMNVLIASAMETAKLLKEAYEETFADQFVTREAPQAQPVPRQQEPQRVVPARSITPRATGGLDPALVVDGTCPEHGCNALPSILKYQEVEMSDEGEERYAKYFCPGKDNGTGTNHALWARELVRAE